MPVLRNGRPVLSSNRIGGELDYSKSACPQRPHYAGAVASAVRDLAAQGLREYDISAQLGIHPVAVRALLQERADASGATRNQLLPVEDAAAACAERWRNSRG